MSVSRRYVQHEDGSGTVYTVTVHPPALSFMPESETAEVSAQLLADDVEQIRAGWISQADFDAALAAQKAALAPQPVAETPVAPPVEAPPQGNS